MNWSSKLKDALRSPKARVQKLRVVVETISSNERLDGLPEVLEALLTAYDNPQINDQLRADVFELLAGSCELCHLMCVEAMSADEGMTLIARQQAVFSRMMMHLLSRPTSVGYSILNPKTGVMVGNFATEGEAQSQLSMMKVWSEKGSQNLMVVPTSITSRFATRPVPEPRQTANIYDPDQYDDPGLPDTLPIPEGIKPSDALKAPSEGLNLEPEGRKSV